LTCYQKDGAWLEVPPDIIWWDEHFPTGQAILFAIDGKPICFFPPRGAVMDALHKLNRGP
jgi:hypothetical protein